MHKNVIMMIINVKPNISIIILHSEGWAGENPGEGRGRLGADRVWWQERK